MQIVEQCRLPDQADAVVTLTSISDTLVVGTEAGAVHVVDWRSRAFTSALRLNSEDSINCVCVASAIPSAVLAATGNQLHVLDLRQLQQPLTTRTIGEEELNDVAVNDKGIAACADDAGAVHLVDVTSQHPPRTLASGHTNICSSVRFHGPSQTHLLSGGFDCRVVKWDAARGKVRSKWQMDVDEQESQNQMFNPPFVHAIAAPPDSKRPHGHYAAVARGDGLVEVFDVDNQIKVSGGKRGSLVGCAVQLSRAHGGHTRAASGVCFPEGGRGGLLVSCGDDQKLCVWDWTLAVPDSKGGLCQPLLAHSQHPHKINCVVSEGGKQGGSCFVGDVEGQVCSYSLQ